MSRPVPGPVPRPRAVAGHGRLDHVSDHDLIATWQLFCRATGEADAPLVAAFGASGFESDHVSEFLERLRLTPDRTLTMGELGAAGGLTSGAVSKLVDRMVEGGLVVRRAAEGDRRVVLAVLTHHGAQVERRSTPAYAALVRSQFEIAGCDRVGRLRALCLRLELERLRAAPVTRARPTAPHVGRFTALQSRIT